MNDLTDEDKLAILEIAKTNTGRVVKNDQGVHWTWGVGYKGRHYVVKATFETMSLRTLVSFEVTDMTDPNYSIPGGHGG